MGNHYSCFHGCIHITASTVSLANTTWHVHSCTHGCTLYTATVERVLLLLLPVNLELEKHLPVLEWTAHVKCLRGNQIRGRPTGNENGLAREIFQASGDAHRPVGPVNFAF